jgi:predicted dehydrogenase
MAIDLALLGCADPALPDVLGVIAAEPDLRLAAVWDGDPALVPAPIRDYAVADPETARARARAAVIGAPAPQRPLLAARAARAGRPALVAVPVAPSAAEARGLLGELRRSRTPVLPALPLRELPALVRLRDALRAGLVGRLAGVEARLLAPPPAADPRRRPSRATPGARGFADLAVHLLDALAFLGEVPRLEAVTLDGEGAGRDLGGAALGRFGGAPLLLRTSLVSRRAELTIGLDGARTRARLRDGALELGDGVGDPERWIGGPPDPGEAMRAFVDRLRRRDFPREPLAGVVRAQVSAERVPRV